jgi:hypothetical protein
MFYLAYCIHNIGMYLWIRTKLSKFNLEKLWERSRKRKKKNRHEGLEE